MTAFEITTCVFAVVVMIRILILEHRVNQLTKAGRQETRQRHPSTREFR